ncbi:pyruvate-formate lyase-activating enzyme [Methanococcus maripaludis]|uniref:Pyruvate-formate lyase-activating enzyme n=1 Tax=Methanococcus maripaludis TaxID=39152 RepID=A0A7J9NVW8_METMI|nr:radical SAM protein [Methanococcus maripaludis]MBA2851832.1 pyruvate-formate lyase-activating enzyme [Methanococcus maripaludis]
MNPRNACMGGFGKCLDVYFTPHCNGSCKFCIESNGYKPEPLRTNVDAMIKATNALPSYHDILILGGEPTTNMSELMYYLRGIHRRGKNLFLTTNGSHLTVENAAFLSIYLKAINISIHHHDMAQNKDITGVELNVENLRKCVNMFTSHNVDVRVNCNLIPGYIDNKEDVHAMEKFAYNIGATAIKFSELQHCDEYADAKNCFDYPLSDDPFKQGCQVTFNGKHIPITVHQTCGFVNKNKPRPNYKGPSYSRTKVLYYNGKVYDGWVSYKKQDSDNELMHIVDGIAKKTPIPASDENESPYECHNRIRGCFSCH